MCIGTKKRRKIVKVKLSGSRFDRPQQTECLFSIFLLSKNNLVFNKGTDKNFYFIVLSGRHVIEPKTNPVLTIFWNAHGETGP